MQNTNGVQLSKILGTSSNQGQPNIYKQTTLTGFSSAEKKLLKDEASRVEDTLLLDNNSDTSKRMFQAVNQVTTDLLQLDLLKNSSPIDTLQYSQLQPPPHFALLSQSSQLYLDEA